MQKIKTKPIVSAIDKLIDDNIEQRTLSHHTYLLEEICKQYRVLPYFDYFIKSSNPDSKNSYHNNNHAYSVALNCFEGGVCLAASYSELRRLLVAGLFHDFAHTQGEDSERVNKSNAVLGFRQAQKFISYEYKLTQEEADDVASMIKTTAMPHKVKVPKSLCQQIIRDADMMTTYEPLELRVNQFLGLYAESNYFYEVSKRKYFFELATKLTSVKWITKWGKVKYIFRDHPKHVRDLMQVVCPFMEVERI